MSAATEIAAAVGEMLDEFGESIKIYGFTPGSINTVSAVITGGAGSFDNVEGGFYDRLALSATVRATDLGSFVPQPGMLVDARSKELRIADDGVTTGRATFHLSLVARDVPRR